MQRLVLTLLTCVSCLTVSAQPQVNVRIQGLSSELADNVRLYLSIEQQKGEPLLGEGRLRRLHDKAAGEIARALQPFGYYRPVIDASLTQQQPQHWDASYNIDPGPPLPIGHFELRLGGEMDQDPEFQALLDKRPLRRGDTFNHLDYERMKSSLARLASERGYFDARFSVHRVEIDLDAYEARIYLHYDGGPRYRFGEVVLTQEVLDPELLRRYIPFGKGTPYTLRGLLELQQALNDSDYFQSVEVSPAQSEAHNNEIPVQVTLTPRKRHRFSVGLGYGTDSGARTRFGWEIPRLNRHGHRISSEARVSESGYRLNSQYRVPVLDPRTDQIIYSASILNERTDTSDSTLRTLGAGLNRGRGQWRESASITYQQEEYSIASDHGSSTLLIPGIHWTRTWGNDFIHTFDGLRLDLGVRGASRRLVSDSDFFQFQGAIKTITPLGRHNRIITRGRLGTTWTETFHQLPSSIRFFAGGAQSVRGYAYQSLGPTDAAGQVVGGKHLLVGSIELEHRLDSRWGMALFLDAGNAIDAPGDALERGAGFGLRWKSPVGPVRVDLASAVSRPGQPWRLHINIGPDL